MSRAVIVELPGYVSPGGLPRALATFGGEESLSTTISTPGAMLQMKLRPEDPSSHPIFGDMALTTSFILRVPKDKERIREAEVF